jgi:hypothetical protein
MFRRSGSCCGWGLDDQFPDSRCRERWQAGRIASPMLLRKLSHEGRHNRLFAAARELGRVLRTVYLPRWISSKEMHQEVSATTNKIESYHAFTKWLDFGGEVITENDPNEQQKRVRYIDLVASAVILQNTVDMMRILQELYAAGEPISVADVEYLSPYMTYGVKRFGNYHLDLMRPPEPWVKESQFREAAEHSRVVGVLQVQQRGSVQPPVGRGDGVF